MRAAAAATKARGWGEVLITTSTQSCDVRRATYWLKNERRRTNTHTQARTRTTHTETRSETEFSSTRRTRGGGRSAMVWSDLETLVRYVHTWDVRRCCRPYVLYSIAWQPCLNRSLSISIKGNASESAEESKTGDAAAASNSSSHEPCSAFRAL